MRIPVPSTRSASRPRTIAVPITAMRCPHARLARSLLVLRTCASGDCGLARLSVLRKSKGHATQAWPCRPGPELRTRYARDGGGSRLCGGGKARHVVRVTVLGSGDAFGSGGRLHSAYLVETPRHTFLLDCGPTILQALKRNGRDPAAVDFVLLSHLHGDHFGGLPFLFMEYRFEEPRSRPLAVYGPPGTERRVRSLFGALCGGRAPPAPPPPPRRAGGGGGGGAPPGRG